MLSAVRSPIAAAAAFAVLAAWFAMSAIDAFPHQQGIDFYQFWGVPLAREAGALRATPYVDPSPYASVLNAMADSSTNEKFRDANRLRRTLEPMATPFLYASFAVFPLDYEKAQLIYTLLLYGAAGAAVFGLARLCGAPPWPAACIALIVLLTYNPFAQDVRSGNVNSLQLALLVGLLAISLRNLFSGNAWMDGLYVGLLGLLVAFKPNTPWIALALALHYLALRGARAFAVGVLEAGLLCIAAFAIGAWQLGGPHAWREWIALARGMDANLPLVFERGNMSIAMVLGRASPTLGAKGYGLVLAAALSLAVLAALTRGGAPADLRRAARAAFADPWLAASIGVLLTLASSPLVWPHYHMLTLIPIAWLVARRRERPLCAWVAGAVYLVMSRAFIDPMVGLGLLGVLHAVTLVSWLALVPIVLMCVALTARAAQRPAPGLAER